MTLLIDTTSGDYDYTYLSLGAGVQSSALLVLSCTDDRVPKPDVAIFADTGDEPAWVYDYLKVLTEPKDALVKQYQRLFEFEDIELEVTVEALSAIATQALERGTGARGLRAILEEVLLDVMYELPGDDEVGRVVVELDSVISRTAPTVFPRSADQPDRAAS